MVDIPMVLSPSGLSKSSPGRFFKYGRQMVQVVQVMANLGPIFLNFKETIILVLSSTSVESLRNREFQNKGLGYDFSFRFLVPPGDLMIQGFTDEIFVDGEFRT